MILTLPLEFSKVINNLALKGPSFMERETPGKLGIGKVIKVIIREIFLTIILFYIDILDNN